MERYEIRCTEEQTRKAFELGAPLQYKYQDKEIVYIEDEGYMKIPTAEQMLNWLEEQGFKFNVYEKFGNSWYYYVGHRTCREPIQEFDNLKSRKEATLAAIDAALEYLSNNKQNVNELTLIVAKTENIKESINTLIQAHNEWKDLGDNVYGGYLYNCLLEVKLLAEEYQKSQIVEYLTNNKK